MGRKLAASAILVVFLAIVSAAQNITATMVGTVRDMTGGVLPGVDINIVHVQTNRSFQLLTDETGSYRIAAFQTGRYFTPNLSADNTSTAQRRDRPNLIGDWRMANRIVDSSQFGKIFTAYASRQVQFGLKVNF